MAVHATTFNGKALLTAVFLFILAMVTTAPVVAQEGADQGRIQGESARGAASPQASPVTEAEIGLIDGTTYQSPQFGYRISWDDGWSADTTSMESNPGISLDRLSIVSGSARFQAFYVAAEGESASEYAERFINFRTSGDPTMRIVTSGDRRGVVWIAYAMESQGSEALGVVEISLVGDGAIMQVIEVIDRSPTFGSAFDSAMASILVEGEPPFRILAGWPG